MITIKLLNIFVKDYNNTGDISVRTKYGLLEAWISIIMNFLLGLLKLIFGITAKSIALVADAFHTLGDMVTSIIVLFGFRAAKLPSDIKHPYGHGRVESISTLIIAVLLIVTGVEFIHAGIDRLRTPLEIRSINWIIIIMSIAAILKEWLARFSFYLGKQINSGMLEADGWHHRSDVFASIMVILAAIGSRIGYPRLDGIFALCIAGLIIWTGFQLAKSMISSLIGEAPSKELINQVINTATGIQGVKGIHGIEIHDYGQTKVCSIHIEVALNLNTSQSHDIADTVEESLKDKLGLNTVVHVDIHKRKL